AVACDLQGPIGNVDGPCDIEAAVTGDLHGLRSIAGLEKRQSGVNAVSGSAKIHVAVGIACDVDAVVGPGAGVVDHDPAAGGRVHDEVGAVGIKASRGQVVDPLAARTGLLEKHQVAVGEVRKIGLARATVGARSEHVDVTVGLYRAIRERVARVG